MTCKKCGAELQEDALVCEACSTAVENEETEVVNEVVEAAEATETEETEEAVAGETEAVEDTDSDEEAENAEDVNPCEDADVDMVADDEENAVEEEPVKKNTFVRVGVPVIIVAVIIVACVVAMFISKRGNNIVARAEYKAPVATAVPSGEPATESLDDLKIFDKEAVVKIDEQLYSYYAGQILGSMQQTYAQYGMSIDASMVESMYESQVYESAISNAKVVKLFEMKADEYDYELSEEIKSDSENQLKEYVTSLVDTEAGETYESSKDEIIRRMYGISYDDFLEAFLRVNRVAEFLENYPEVPEITEEQLMEYYEAYKDAQFATRKVKHILISTMDQSGQALGKKETAKKKALADKLAKQINNGANIDDLIKKYTDDVDTEGNPNNNGEYSVAGDGSYVAEFEDWAMSHTTEDKAEVVQTTYGYHVMKMSEYSVTPYEEVKGTLRGMIVSEEGSLLAQAMQITYKNEDLLNDCKTQLMSTLPTPMPVEPVAETTPAPAATSAAQ